jgi:NADH-quinone oxidoreductase subunit F
VIVLDETDDMVKAVHVLIKFFDHESCGKCTPCREGLFWVRQIIERILSGDGREEDLDLLLDVSENISTTSFCGLGEASVSALVSTIKKFRNEFMAYISTPEEEAIESEPMEQEQVS